MNDNALIGKVVTEYEAGEYVSAQKAFYFGFADQPDNFQELFTSKHPDWKIGGVAWNTDGAVFYPPLKPYSDFYATAVNVHKAFHLADQGRAFKIKHAHQSKDFLEEFARRFPEWRTDSLSMFTTCHLPPSQPEIYMTPPPSPNSSPLVPRQLVLFRTTPKEPSSPPGSKRAREEEEETGHPKKWLNWVKTPWTEEYREEMVAAMDFLSEIEPNRCCYVKANGGERCDNRVGNPNKTIQRFVCVKHRRCQGQWNNRLPLPCKECKTHYQMRPDGVCTRCFDNPNRRKWIKSPWTKEYITSTREMLETMVRADPKRCCFVSPKTGKRCERKIAQQYVCLFHLPSLEGNNDRLPLPCAECRTKYQLRQSGFCSPCANGGNTAEWTKQPWTKEYKEAMDEMIKSLAIEDPERCYYMESTGDRCTNKKMEHCLVCTEHKSTYDYHNQRLYLPCSKCKTKFQLNQSGICRLCNFKDKKRDWVISPWTSQYKQKMEEFLDSMTRADPERCCYVSTYGESTNEIPRCTNKRIPNSFVCSTHVHFREANNNRLPLPCVKCRFHHEVSTSELCRHCRRLLYECDSEKQAWIDSPWTDRYKERMEAMLKVLTKEDPKRCCHVKYGDSIEFTRCKNQRLQDSVVCRPHQIYREARNNRMPLPCVRCKTHYELSQSVVCECCIRDTTSTETFGNRYRNNQ